jgi:hypothetical protein
MTSAIRVLARAVLVPWLAASSGCSSDVDIPPDSELPEISVSALATEVSAQGLALTSGWLALAKLTFVPCDPGSASLGTTDFPVNLFVEPPSSLLLDSAVSDYCRIQATLAPGTESYPQTLEGLSVHVAGALADDTPFELSSTVPASLEFVSASGKPFAVTKLWLGVDFDVWFADADVTSAEVSDDVVLIDAEHNDDVLASFDAATSLALSLYVDANDDGKLTDDELEPVARATAP